MYKQQKTFQVISLGCRVNEAEKLAIERSFQKHGYVYTPINPDFIVINTCAVTAKAEREARQLIYQLSKKYTSKIIITGCSGTYWKKQKKYNQLPFDLLVDNIQKDFLVDIINKKFFRSVKPLKSKRNDTVVTDKFLSSARVMIKIQDGCHRFCSYCIVPYLRGTPQSKRIKDILSTIQSYKNHPNEVILTAINTESYGKESDESLINLIQTITSQTKIPRVSFGSIHPWSLTTDFLNWYKNAFNKNRFVNFFHVPVQSGCDSILRLMKRDYTSREVKTQIDSIKRINPNAFISTDVIVGFLDESDSDFQTTYDFLSDSPFSKFHVFRFSRRNSTAAFYLAKRLSEPSPKTKENRSQILRELSQKKYEAFQKTQIGRISQALFIDSKTKSMQKALLDNQIPVNIPDSKYLNGTIHPVQIVDFYKGKLIAKSLSAS